MRMGCDGSSSWVIANLVNKSQRDIHRNDFDSVFFVRCSYLAFNLTFIDFSSTTDSLSRTILQIQHYFFFGIFMVLERVVVNSISSSTSLNYLIDWLCSLHLLSSLIPFPFLPQMVVGISSSSSVESKTWNNIEEERELEMSTVNE